LVQLPALLRGGAPVDVRPPSTMAPWSQAHIGADPARIGSDPNEALTRYYPWLRFIAETDNPTDVTWYPLEQGGLPFLGLWRSRTLCPFTLPFYVLDINTGIVVSAYMKLLIAGVCAFVVARRLGLSIAASLFVAISFQMSAPFLLGAAYPTSDVLAWFPAAVLVADRLAHGRFRQILLGAVVGALMLLGGEIETIISIGLFLTIFLIVYSAYERRGALGSALVLSSAAAAAALAAGLAATQLGPYFEFVGQAVANGAGAVDVPISPAEIAGLFAPGLLPLGGEAAAESHLMLHVGFVQALLLPVWLSLRPFTSPRHRMRVESLWLASLLMFIGALAAGRFLAHVPLLRSIQPEHWLLANTFAIATAAAITGEEWIHLNAGDMQRTIKRLAVAGPIAFLLASASLVAPLGEYPPGGWLDWLPVFSAAALLISMVILFGGTVFAPSHRIMGYTLSALAFLNAMLAFAPHLPFTPRDQIFPETDLVRLLKSDHGTVAGAGELASWPLAGNGVAQLEGASGVRLRRERDFQLRIDQDPLLLRRSGATMLLFTQDDLQGNFAAIRSSLRIEQVLPSGAVLFRDMQAKPKAWVTYEARMVDSYDPSQLTSTLPPLVEHAQAPLGPARADTTANVDPVSSNTRVVVRLENAGRGILVLAEAWYPGWTAVVDGVDMPVFPVDLMFRGVEIPDGAREVVFIYRPASLRWGIYVTFGAAAAIAVAALTQAPSLLRGFRKGRKRRY
jgi:hypothetical protein